MNGLRFDIMGRKKLISEVDILKAKSEIENGKSLREKAREMNIHPSSLSDRIKKINGQSILLKPDNNPTKPDSVKKLPDIITRHKEIKPDTKPEKKEIHLSISLLRGMHELILGKSDQHKNSRNQLLDIFINEFQRQKELIR
jgi:F0F1-type ATP synthase alpha subunit